MDAFRIFALAGAAALALGATAVAAEKAVHVMTVRLPDGAVEQIRYAGDTPPRIHIQTGAVAPAMLAPLGAGLFDDPAFARLNQISAMMDRQAALMWRALDSAPAANGLTLANLDHLPAGARGFSMVSTVTGSGVCTRSVEYIAGGAGKPPKMTTRSSGACGGAALHGGPAAGPTGAAVPAAYAPSPARAEPAHWH
jgi:hypothetical protein